MTYRRAPAAIAHVLDAPAVPSVVVSPTCDTFAILTPLRYPPIADLARPMLRLAGLRIDPDTNAVHRAASATSVTIVRVRDGASRTIPLPRGARIIAFRFSPDGAHFACANATRNGTELYIGSTAKARLRRIDDLRLNCLFGVPFAWMPGSARLLVLAVARKRKAPREPSAPPGPIVQETAGRAGAVVTFGDLLRDAHDETLFEYYATSRLAIVDVARESVRPLGKRAIYTSFCASPSGEYVLVDTLHRPYSYLFPFDRFPTTTTVVDFHGKRVATIHEGRLLDDLPVDGVPTGPRDIAWRPTAPASLGWFAALDTGDPRVAAPYRDAIVSSDAPFTTPREFGRTVGRAVDITWFEAEERAFVSEYDRDARLTTTSLLDVRTTRHRLTPFGAALRDGDRYNDPGTPLTRVTTNDQRVVICARDSVFLSGAGYGPSGRRPFLDRTSVIDGSSERLFESALAPLDTVVTIADSNASKILLMRQSPTSPPNLYLHRATGDRALTAFTDPTPMLRAIERRVVTYSRADGVALSFTLYLPPGYTPGTALPTVLWAYPAEYNDSAVASQNVNDTQTFSQPSGASQILLALAGYAVLDNAAIPIVGAPETVNDTYIEQLVAGAKAAIDAAVELGVTDRARVAAGGHSYGAFMTMNLLAHTPFFRAGIARSGAYNRTLTPFGFQNERRSYWEARDLYSTISPFAYADRITQPVLLVHGMVDENSGTYPIQSERMYAALKGNGGTARFVQLPNEGHGYLARETVETVLAEMVDWLERWLAATR